METGFARSPRRPRGPHSESRRAREAGVRDRLPGGDPAERPPDLFLKRRSRRVDLEPVEGGQFSVEIAPKGTPGRAPVRVGLPGDPPEPLLHLLPEPVQWSAKPSAQIRSSFSATTIAPTGVSISVVRTTTELIGASPTSLRVRGARAERARREVGGGRAPEAEAVGDRDLRREDQGDEVGEGDAPLLGLFRDVAAVDGPREGLLLQPLQDRLDGDVAIFFVGRISAHAPTKPVSSSAARIARSIGVSRGILV